MEDNIVIMSSLVNKIHYYYCVLYAKKELNVVYSLLIHDCTTLPHVKTFLSKILSEPKASKSLYIL